MSSSFDFDEPDHFTAGTVGEPGQRVFYLQARQGDERGQPPAREAAGGRARRVPRPASSPTCPTPSRCRADLDLVEPVIAEWVVGALAVAYEEADDRILLVAEELIASPTTRTTPTTSRRRRDPATARFRLTRGQVAAFIAHADELVHVRAAAVPAVRQARSTPTATPARRLNWPTTSDGPPDDLIGRRTEPRDRACSSGASSTILGRMPWSSNGTFLVERLPRRRRRPRRSTSPTGASDRCGTSPTGSTSARSRPTS